MREGNETSMKKNMCQREQLSTVALMIRRAEIERRARDVEMICETMTRAHVNWANLSISEMVAQYDYLAAAVSRYIVEGK